MMQSEKAANRLPLADSENRRTNLKTINNENTIVDDPNEIVTLQYTSFLSLQHILHMGKTLKTG